MEVAVEEVTTALLSFENRTMGLVPKFVPVRIMVAPTAPLVGEKEVKVGVGKTVKLVALEAVTPPVVTDIKPVVAPTGTVTVMEPVVEAVTVACVPLN